MTNFLMELRSEEIPARMQGKAKEDLARLFGDALAKAGLKTEGVETFATPRRLALIASGLPLETAAVSEETKGPKAGAPPQALEGFLRKTGLTQDQLVERDGVYFAVVEKPGRKTADVLAEAIPAIIRAFPWPKSQRWGAASISTESLRWVRPLQGIVALLGDDIIPCELAGIDSGRDTLGHRFHSTGPIEIANPAAYVETLRAAHVIVHFSERCRIIREGASKCAADAGLVLVEDEGLVAENAGLTEWPVPMLGRFDPAFLAVPEEVIQLTARVNQKYFICRDGAGKLANAFICTANIVANDGGAAIVAGNEKVLAARLSDAKFFWEQDLKVRLEDHAKKLSNIVFHEKLGTVADKVERVATLARWLVESGVIHAEGTVPSEAQRTVPGGAANGTVPKGGQSPTQALLADQAERAAQLCKADLVTGMVGEFPELQGIMGGYYARAQGEGDAVADAVRDHYTMPMKPVSVALALADKLDTIRAFFHANERPTGSKDPYALRRAAIQSLFMIMRGLRLDLAKLVNQDVIDFFIERWMAQNKAAGGQPDLIAAVRAATMDGDLFRLGQRMRALEEFVATAEGVNLLAAYKRAANIVKGTVPSGTVPDGGAIRGQSLNGQSPAECELAAALDSAEPLAAAAIEAEDFEAAMAALASLRAPIDAFFEGVMVNDPDETIRAYRMGLLARFRDAVHQVADFSKIEG